LVPIYPRIIANSIADDVDKEAVYGRNRYGYKAGGFSFLKNVSA